MATDLKIFCENVKLLRFSHDLTLDEMAEIAGISVDTLIRIENLNMPDTVTVDIIFNLYKHFHVHPNHLFTEGMKED